MYTRKYKNIAIMKVYEILKSFTHVKLQKQILTRF